LVGVGPKAYTLLGPKTFDNNQLLCKNMAEDFMKKIVLEVSSEMMIDEWIPIFRLILQFLTYGQDSIDELLPLEDE